MGTPIPSSSLVFKTREYYVENTDPDIAKGDTLSFLDLDKTLLFLSQSVASASANTTIYDPAFPDSATTPQDVGGINQDTTAGTLRGKTLTEMFDLLLFPVLPPEANPGGFSSTISPSSLQEVGTTINVNLVSTFTQGTWTSPNPIYTVDYYGPFIDYYFQSGSTLIDQRTSNATFNNVKVLLGTNSFPTFVSYSAGEQPLYSDGTAYTDPPQLAGVLSDSNTFTGVYPILFGTSATNYSSTGDIYGDAGISKTLINSNPASGTTVSITLPNTTNKFIYIAYPSAWGTLSQIKDETNQNNITSFTSYTRNINGSTNWSGVSYIIWKLNYVTNTPTGNDNWSIVF